MSFTTWLIILDQYVTQGGHMPRKSGSSNRSVSNETTSNDSSTSCHSHYPTDRLIALFLTCKVKNIHSTTLTSLDDIHDQLEDHIRTSVFPTICNGDDEQDQLEPDQFSKWRTLNNIFLIFKFTLELPKELSQDSLTQNKHCVHQTLFNSVAGFMIAKQHTHVIDAGYTIEIQVKLRPAPIPETLTTPLTSASPPVQHNSPVNDDRKRKISGDQSKENKIGNICREGKRRKEGSHSSLDSIDSSNLSKTLTAPISPLNLFPALPTSQELSTPPTQQISPATTDDSPNPFPSSFE